MQEHKVENLYDGVRGIAVKILNRVERTDSYLDKLLESELRNSELSGVDKALLYEIVHGVVRWTGRLDWILNGFYKGQFSKAIPNLKNGLRVALYQILFLDKVPDHAAVNEAVEFVKKLQGQKPADLTNAILRNIIRSKAGIRYPDQVEDVPGYLAAFLSHPSWMVKRYLARFGRENTEKLLAANNERPVITLKYNSTKIHEMQFKELLKNVNLRYVQGKYLKEYFKLQNLSNITSWDAYQQGLFDVQDEAQGFSCKLLDVKPGMRVLDLCAAPGGKSSFIAALMQNSGEIVAVDKFESRLETLKKNIDRLGFSIIKPVVADALEFEENNFDRVIVDVPCSGTGTLSKKPDIKWKKDLLDIRRLNESQYALLNKASKLVAEGGSIVYSTCSIEPEENEMIIQKFLEKNPDFQLDNASNFVPADVVNANGYVEVLPHLHNLDGAFAAKIIKVKKK